VKPVSASDDGVQTRLTFGARAEVPAIFVRNPDDSESLLNFSMDGGDVVIIAWRRDSSFGEVG